MDLNVVSTFLPPRVRKLGPRGINWKNEDENLNIFIPYSNIHSIILNVLLNFSGKIFNTIIKYYYYCYYTIIKSFTKTFLPNFEETYSTHKNTCIRLITKYMVHFTKASSESLMKDVNTNF